MCKIIVGNKVDCKETERQVSFQEGEALAKKYGVTFIECSAKDNYNISDIFTTIGKPIKERLLDGETSKGNTNIKIDSGDVKKKGEKKNCECWFASSLSYLTLDFYEIPLFINWKKVLKSIWF